MSRPVIVYAKVTGAVLATLALVVGVPVGLVTLVGWPLPRSLPSPAEVSDAFARQGVPTEVLVNALAVIVWFAWVQIVWAFAVEAVAVARGRAAQRAAVLPGIQVLAGQLIAGIALVASAVGPARPVGAVVLTVPPPEHISALPSRGAAPPATTGSTTPDRPLSAPQAAAVAPALGGEHTVYETKRGDTFWRLAQDHLGSGTRWREIRDLNVGRAVAAGQVLAADEDRLQPGWRILLPVPAGRGAAAAAASAAPDAAEPGFAVGRPQEVTVAAGDHFWGLAADQLRQAWGREPRDAEVVLYWRALVATNRHRLLPPHDPDMVFPGQQVVMPASRADPAAPPSTPPAAPAPPSVPAAASGPPAAEPAGAPGGPDAPLLPAQGMVRYEEADLSADDEADEVDAVTIAFSGDGPPPTGDGMVRYEEDDLRDEEDPDSGVGQRFLASDGPPWRPRPAHLARRRRR